MKLLIQLLSLYTAAVAFTVQDQRSMRSTALSMSDMQTGTVKWFNTQKGFGFIDPDGDGPDVFVHQTDIKADGFRSLADGENVEYVPQEDAQGRLKATKVTGPGGENVQGAPYENPGSYDDGY